MNNKENSLEAKEQLMINEGLAIQCPSCNTLITNVLTPCPICGCSEMKFLDIVKVKNLSFGADGSLKGFKDKVTEKKIEEDIIINRQKTSNVQYDVNPAAEKVANAFAKVILWIYIILGIISIIIGLVFCIDEDLLGLVVLFAGILSIVIGIIIWASFKLIVNMSRNLFNINNTLNNLCILIAKKK